MGSGRAQVITSSAKLPQTKPSKPFRVFMKSFVTGMSPVFTVIIASIAFGACGGPSAPAGLLVNGVSNPLAIDRNSTRFTWMSVDTGQGVRQTAYQLLVASDLKELAAGNPGWWDSGKVESDRS